MKKYKSQGKAVEMTVNNKEENSEDFCLDFVREFGLWISYRFGVREVGSGSNRSASSHLAGELPYP